MHFNTVTSSASLAGVEVNLFESDDCNGLSRSHAGLEPDFREGLREYRSILIIAPEVHNEPTSTDLPECGYTATKPVHVKCVLAMTTPYTPNRSFDECTSTQSRHVAPTSVKAHRTPVPTRTPPAFLGNSTAPLIAFK